MLLTGMAIDEKVLGMEIEREISVEGEEFRRGIYKI